MVPNDKNKSSMNKKHELFEILKDVKRGNKMAAEAYDEILLLFNVVGQSEQFKPFKEAKGMCKKCLRHWCICNKKED